MTYFVAGKVARFDPTTKTFKEYDAPGGPRSGPYSVVVDSIGHVWFNQFDGKLNDLVELDPATGRMTSYKIPTGPALVRKLSVDAHNTVWYANNGAGKIGRSWVGSQPSRCGRSSGGIGMSNPGGSRNGRRSRAGSNASSGCGAITSHQMVSSPRSSPGQ